MGALDNLNRNQLAELVSRVRALEKATSVTNSAIGRGGLLVYDGGVITIENGGLDVTGSATISGVLSVTGTTTLSGSTSMTGPTNVSGPFTVTGATDLNGNTSINGTLEVTNDTTISGALSVTGDSTISGKLDVTGNTTISGTLNVTGAMATKSMLSVEGATTLKNNLNVVSGGKITAGNVKINPDKNGGSVEFTGNRIIRDTGSSLIIDNGSGTATVSVTSSHVLLEAGTATVDVVGNAVGVVGDFHVTGDTYLNLPATTNNANVYFDWTTGKLYVKS